LLFSAKTVRTEGDQKDMEHKVIRLKCPGCGAAVSLEQRECEYCQQPLVPCRPAYGLLSQNPK